MAKKHPKPYSDIENGTQQIYFDSDHDVWKVRQMHQNDPGNVRSPKKWRDIDIANADGGKEKLIARHPQAQVMP